MRPAPAVLLAFSFFAAASVFAADAPPPPAPPPAVMTEAECAVWDREMSFAQSVADHDAAAFAEHIAPGAAFGANEPQPTHGREAIARQWAGIVAGTRVRLEWYPTRTTIASDGDVAWSSGPALTEVLAPDAKPRFLLGGYRSVWHREADGAWRVLFDGGIPPREVTEAQAAAFRAARPARCPRG